MCFVDIGLSVSFNIPFIVSLRLYRHYANALILLPEESTNVHWRCSKKRLLKGTYKLFGFVNVTLSLWQSPDDKPSIIVNLRHEGKNNLQFGNQNSKYRVARKKRRDRSLCIN